MALEISTRTTVERQVLIGMIFSSTVLSTIAEYWDRGMFASDWANLVGSWCVNHYRENGKAPGRAVSHHFLEWAEKERDQGMTSVIETFIHGMTEEAERVKKEFEADYLIVVARKHFDKVRLVKLKEDLSACLESGDVEKAGRLVETSRRLDIGRESGIDVLGSDRGFEEAFSFREEPVISYPDALGNFFGTSLCRDALISFMGREKIGKSYCLQDLAWTAVSQEHNTAYFEMGDSSQWKVLLRFAARMAGRPLAAGSYEIPESIISNGSKNLPTLETSWMRCAEDLTVDDVKRVRRRWARELGDKRFKLSCHPNSTLSAVGIENIIDVWGRQDWRPDVVIIDYADIMAPLDSRATARDQINATWKALKGLSQKYHCLVVTATQADADAYSAHTLSLENFSEDKRKYSQVDGMVSINQTEEEKKRGLYRLKWLLRRDLDFTQSVWTAGNLAMASPFMLSTF